MTECTKNKGAKRKRFKKNEKAAVKHGQNSIIIIHNKSSSDLVPLYSRNGFNSVVSHK
jgi:hypothetical protein